MRFSGRTGLWWVNDCINVTLAKLQLVVPLNTHHFSYGSKLCTNAGNCELPTLWLPVPSLHQHKLSNGITVRIHGSLPATDHKFISPDAGLLALFQYVTLVIAGIWVEIKILRTKCCSGKQHILKIVFFMIQTEIQKIKIKRDFSFSFFVQHWFYKLLRPALPL